MGTRSWGRSRPVSLVIGCFLALTIATSAVVFNSPEPAAALSGTDFHAGRIIDDSKFYDGNAMSESQIQSFLSGMGSGLASMNFAVASRGLSVSDSTGNLRCNAFQGGTLAASTIIFRAQVACNLSAKVILVTLQKEQGLITKAAPSQAALDRAMGMACPDTAPCAVDTLGFGNQIYAGSRQLVTYKASRFGVQPGVRNVLWNPNAGCGSGSVNIQNYATAALYNYTPYQPNPAALANVTGLGDGCSSYGNRNFWVYYSTWFGPTTTAAAAGQEQIAAFYAAQGGAAGALGASTSTVQAASTFGGGLFQTFANGSIYWTSSYGTYSVTGSVLTAYNNIGAFNGSLGWPTTGTVAESAQGISGVVQSFQFGTIYSSSTTGARAIIGPLSELFESTGGPPGTLGWPTTPGYYDSANGSGTQQQFQKGTIFWSASGGAHALYAPMLTSYQSLGGQQGALGWPISDEYAVTANDGGKAQGFQNGSLYWSPSAGGFAVSGAIRDKYWSVLGEGGFLGFPISAQTCASGTCTQVFKNGTIVWTASGGAQVIQPPSPEIQTVYSSLGGASGSLGPIISPVFVESVNGGGKAQGFQNGSIYWSAASGGWAVSGAIRDAYWSVLGEGGALGWPTGAAVPSSANGGGSVQTFQGGSIYSSGSGGARVMMSGAILTAYGVAGGPAGALGWPISGPYQLTVNGGGKSQGFQNGSIYQSSLGAFAVSGVFRSVYWSVLGEGGPLGWPTAAPTCAGGQCTQTFQNANIISTGASTARVASTSPEIDAVHQSLGGASGSLGQIGSPVFVESVNGGGKAQGFQNGSIYWSAASGGWAVSGAIRDAYWSVLGEGGALGWPTGAAVPSSANGGGSVQTFQGGRSIRPHRVVRE
ncbi:hypothetical protein [Frigoribacterium sp. UYMn621]|uniref:hypothetical protein n=1 Tax=Frigoribacterium sp. UYMn621 TaxID=3156343 RepID=UPI003390B9D5